MELLGFQAGPVEEEPIVKPIVEDTNSIFPDLNLWSEELEEGEDLTGVIAKTEE